MHRAQELVIDFMVLAGQDIPAQPTVPDRAVRGLRSRLIQEELNELITHTDDYNRQVDLVAVADDIADLLYVVYGTAVAYGIDIEPIFEAVHDSNMAKFGPGGHRRGDGKWIKAADWRPPNIAALLQTQMGAVDAAAGAAD